ncbi:MAG: ABC transporter permease subunit [Oscillospiraceae bacterium]|nr:ABC transporter permease subunit [Oscillospiraceae bacterium]
MINSMQRAIIEKDIRFVKTTRGNLSSVLVVSLMFGVVFPAIFIVITYFTPEEMGELGALFGMLPGAMSQAEVNLAILSILLDSIVPMFFLMIPVIATTAMASGSFVGEKEKRTLETLLYSPISLRKIFSAKVLASLFLSMAVTIATFISYIIVSQIMIYLMFGQLMLPGANWYLTVFVVAPVLTLLAVTITSKISAKAQTMEEAFQKAGLITLPVIVLAATQFSGLMMLNAWMLLILAAVIGVAAFILMQSALKNFNYEMLLK